MILFLFVRGVYSQKGFFDLGEIVVTPLKIEREIKDIPHSVSVVNYEDIELSTSNSSTEILNYLPGVFIQKTGPFGRADVVIRGLGSRGRRVAVLIDGNPQKMGLFGCTVTHAFTLDNVERVEVIRGSSSVLYGSGALGGVVNILTKKPEKYKTDLTLSYGSYDTQIYRLRSGMDLEKINWYFTVDKRSSRGHLPNSDYWHNSFTLKLDKDLTDNLSVTLSSRYFDGFKREPSPAAGDSWNKYKRGIIDLTFKGNLWGEKELKIYRNFGHHRFSNNWHSKDYTQGVTFHLKLNPTEKNSLLIGAEFTQQAGKVYSGAIPGKYDKNDYAFFFLDEQKLFQKKVTANFGLRYDEDNLSGSILVPSAGVLWHIFPFLTLRTSAERGFRFPQLNELRFFAISNPDLKPEKSWHYEWGWSYKKDNLNLDFVYFILKAKDFIAVRSGKFQNINKLEFKGIETSLSYTFSKISFLASFSHLHTGKYTQGRPQNKLDLVFSYKGKKFSLSLDGQYVDNYFAQDEKKQALPNFFLVNAKLIYSFSKSFQIFLNVNNLFNVEHKLYLDLPGTSAGVYTQPKRNFLLGIVYKW